MAQTRGLSKDWWGLKNSLGIPPKQGRSKIHRRSQIVFDAISYLALVLLWVCYYREERFRDNL